MTFSIVGRMGDALGVAVASKFLAAGALVPWARAGAGALATQAYANLSYGPRGLDLLTGGLAAADVIAELTAPDAMAAQRQIGVVRIDGAAATFTGAECMEWAGGRTGDGYAAQGNILTGPQTIDAMCEAFESAGGDLPARLLAALTAGDRAGGDRRGRQAAGLIVVSPAGGYGGTTDVVVDLRVDDHPDPCTELARLLDLHRLYFDKPTPDDLIHIDAALASELQQRLAALGYEIAATAEYDRATQRAMERFAGWENLEERLVDGPMLDRHILDALRARS